MGLFPVRCFPLFAPPALDLVGRKLQSSGPGKMFSGSAVFFDDHSLSICKKWRKTLTEKGEKHLQKKGKFTCRKHVTQSKYTQIVGRQKAHRR